MGRLLGLVMVVVTLVVSGVAAVAEDDSRSSTSVAADSSGGSPASTANTSLADAMWREAEPRWSGFGLMPLTWPQHTRTLTLYAKYFHSSKAADPVETLRPFLGDSSWLGHGQFWAQLLVVPSLPVVRASWADGASLANPVSVLLRLAALARLLLDLACLYRGAGEWMKELGGDLVGGTVISLLSYFVLWWVLPQQLAWLWFYGQVLLVLPNFIWSTTRNVFCSRKSEKMQAQLRAMKAQGLTPGMARTVSGGGGPAAGSKTTGPARKRKKGKKKDRPSDRK